MLGTLRLAAGAPGSGICKGKWGFLGEEEVASLALLHLRVDISATADPYLGARECLGTWCSPGGARARDSTSERWRRLARDPGNEIRESDKVPASKHTQRWGGRGTAGLGYHHCQSVSPEEQPGEPSPFREMNNGSWWGRTGRGSEGAELVRGNPQWTGRM